MKYDIGKTIEENLNKIYAILTKFNEDARDVSKQLKTESDTLLNVAQSETDEMLLDQEERLILLEVGE